MSITCRLQVSALFRRSHYVFETTLLFKYSRKAIIYNGKKIVPLHILYVTSNFIRCSFVRKAILKKHDRCPIEKYEQRRITACHVTQGSDSFYTQCSIVQKYKYKYFVQTKNFNKKFRGTSVRALLEYFTINILIYAYELNKYEISSIIFG